MIEIIKKDPNDKMAKLFAALRSTDTNSNTLKEKKHNQN